MLIFILIFILLFVCFEMPGLIKKKQWLELGLGSGILLLAIVYGLEVNFEWHLLPNPNFIIKKLNPLTDSLSVFFHLPS